MVLTLPKYLKCRAHSRLEVTSAAVVPLTTAKVQHPTYGPCQAVLVTVEDQSIRRTLDGTTPTTGADGVGAIMVDGSSLLIQGGLSVANLKMIAVGTSGIVQVDYFYE